MFFHPLLKLRAQGQTSDYSARHLIELFCASSEFSDQGKN
jgi:hypothetical protein